MKIFITYLLLSSVFICNAQKENDIKTKLDSDKKSKNYEKYNPASSFQDYAVEIYKGKLASPDFSTNPDSKRFRTRIINACNEGINFAGHFTLVIWGCGTACQNSVIIDRKTGHIYDGFITSRGAEFRKDSKMIIMNIGALDKETNLIELCASCGELSHEIWTGKEFEKNK